MHLKLARLVPAAVPIAGLGMCVVAVVVTTTGSGFGPESQILEICSWMIALALPAMAGAFLVGLARWRLFTAAAMQRLATRLHGHARPEDLRAALADAFDDPSLDIAYWLDDGGGKWVDANGDTVRPPPPGSGRCLTEVRDDERRVAAIVHDAALRDDQAFIATATSYSVMTLDHQRLSVQAAALVREVHDSRARIQATADDERRRIERDIHDGAQQRLVALRINLELAAEQTEGEDPGRAKVLRALGTDVDEAIDQVRSLARGIYPAALADRGPGRRVALGRASIRAADNGARRRRPALLARDRERLLLLLPRGTPERRQARPRPTAAVVVLSDNGALRLEVRDDGAGFDVGTAPAGAGFVNMRDRLAAVDGELVTVSSPGHGTRLIVTIPLEATAEAPAV